MVRAVYLADCEDTAWAEWMRAIAEAGIDPATSFPRSVFTLDVDVTGIADLRTPAKLRRVAGVRTMQPTRRRWPVTQPVGDNLWRAGAHGIVAPSAAHGGHEVLTLFRTAVAVPGLVERGAATTYLTMPRIPTGLRT